MMKLKMILVILLSINNICNAQEMVDVEDDERIQQILDSGGTVIIDAIDDGFYEVHE